MSESLRIVARLCLLGIKLFKLKQKAACMVAGITPRALRKGNTGAAQHTFNDAILTHMRSAS